MPIVPWSVLGLLGGYFFTEISDEPLVKPSQPRETPDIFHTLRLRPFNNGSHLLWTWLDTLLRDVESQVLDPCLKECTFVQTGIKSRFSQFLQCSPDVLNMVFERLGVNEYIIKVDQYKVVQFFFEYRIHQALKC